MRKSQYEREGGHPRKYEAERRRREWAAIDKRQRKKDKRQRRGL